MPYFKFLRFEDKFDRHDPALKINLIGATPCCAVSSELAIPEKI
jgi:hypothetical protein